MRTSLLTTLVTALIALAFVGIAGAQSAKPTAKQLEEARKHFTAAETAKARGDFKTAAVEYLAAYEQFQDPEFFFNVAEVYKLGNDEENALAYYQKYLQLDPNGRGAAAARTAVDALTRSIAAKQDAARHEAEAKRKADEEAKRKADEEAKRQADEQAKLEQEQTQVDAPTPSRPGGTLRIAGIATAGAGVAAVGVGIFFGLRAKSISNEAAEWDMFDQARFDQGEAAERNMFIFTGIGGAALITGGVLYYLGHRAGATATDSGSEVTVAPIITPSAVTFAASGRF